MCSGPILHRLGVHGSLWLAMQTQSEGQTSLPCGPGERPKAARQWCSTKTCPESEKVYLVATNSFGKHPLKNHDPYPILVSEVAPPSLRVLSGHGSEETRVVSLSAGLAGKLVQTIQDDPNPSKLT